jgi:hypothetical protein
MSTMPSPARPPEPADADLLAAFEAATLPRDQWTHREHVRIAFLYASRLELTQAIDRMRYGLLALNKAHGTPESLTRGYHETITVAFMRLIVAACQAAPYNSSGDFCSSRPELMAKDALLKHYSRDRLFSWEAKTSWVEPDLKPLPEVRMTSNGYL